MEVNKDVTSKTMASLNERKGVTLLSSYRGQPKELSQLLRSEDKTSSKPNREASELVKSIAERKIPMLEATMTRDRMHNELQQLHDKITRLEQKLVQCPPPELPAERRNACMSLRVPPSGRPEHKPIVKPIQALNHFLSSRTSISQRPNSLVPNLPSRQIMTNNYRHTISKCSDSLDIHLSVGTRERDLRPTHDINQPQTALPSARSKPVEPLPTKGIPQGQPVVDRNSQPETIRKPLVESKENLNCAPGQSSNPRLTNVMGRLGSSDQSQTKEIASEAKHEVLMQLTSCLENERNRTKELKQAVNEWQDRCINLERDYARLKEEHDALRANYRTCELLRKQQQQTITQLQEQLQIPKRPTNKVKSSGSTTTHRSAKEPRTFSGKTYAHC